MNVQIKEYVGNGQLNTSELYNSPHVVDNLLVCHFLWRERGNVLTPEQFSVKVRCLNFLRFSVKEYT